MYIPDVFSVEDREEVLNFIEHYGFGELISTVNGRLFVTHLPFMLNDSKTTLICHLAKLNPQWQEIENQEVLITFMDNHAYVSPAWYEKGGVPTWNYQAVHVYGRARSIVDAVQLKHMVENLSSKFEADREPGWNRQYSENLLSAIVGLEIEITELQCKYKLSQNKNESERQNISKELHKAGYTRLSTLIK